jgi:hypothetical protein
MRIEEVLYWNNNPAEDRYDPYLDVPPGPSDKVTDLARAAFTRDGRVKLLWDLDRLERHFSGATPSDAETELTPSDNSEPPLAWQDHPAETDPTPGPNGLVRSRQYPRLPLGRA